MKQKINQRREALQEKEKKILLELETNEEQLKTKAKSVFKIALISGLVALIAYWGYKAFSDEPIKERAKKKRKKKKSNSRLGQIISPFLVKYLSEILELDKDKEEKS